MRIRFVCFASALNVLTATVGAAPAHADCAGPSVARITWPHDGDVDVPVDARIFAASVPERVFLDDEPLTIDANLFWGSGVPMTPGEHVVRIEYDEQAVNRVGADATASITFTVGDAPSTALPDGAARVTGINRLVGTPSFTCFEPAPYDCHDACNPFYLGVELAAPGAVLLEVVDGPSSVGRPMIEGFFDPGCSELWLELCDDGRPLCFSVNAYAADGSKRVGDEVCFPSPLCADPPPWLDLVEAGCVDAGTPDSGRPPPAPADAGAGEGGADGGPAADGGPEGDMEGMACSGAHGARGQRPGLLALATTLLVLCWRRRR